MISVAEAKLIIAGNIDPLKPQLIPLSEASGMHLAEDIYAITDIPPFNQSALDGYAFAYDDWQQKKRISILGEIPAGSGKKENLIPQFAVRIFTGAAIPTGADTIVMQEHTNNVDGILQITNAELIKGNAFRPKGSEIKSGALALEKGSYLSPAAIGFLASIGITHVLSYPWPTLSIIVTGNELQEPGKQLKYGQIYESNSFALMSALNLLRLPVSEIKKVEDKIDTLKLAITSAMNVSDIILITGGVSAGDYDFVPDASMECGFRTLFHKVKQRPGKPLFFAKKENKYIIGLPGNPSSVLTCFYEYVIPALNRLNKSIPELKIIQAPISINHNKKSGLTHFLKASYNGETVTPLDAQESYRLSSFAKSNCLICLDESVTECNAGGLVDVHLLLN